MSQSQDREELIAFLDGIRRPDMAVTAIADEDSLTESGLIDSLSVLEIMLYLETKYNIDFASEGFDPADLGSISDILSLVARRAA